MFDYYEHLFRYFREDNKTVNVYFSEYIDLLKFDSVIANKTKPVKFGHLFY